MVCCPRGCTAAGAGTSSWPTQTAPPNGLAIPTGLSRGPTVPLTPQIRLQVRNPRSVAFQWLGGGSVRRLTRGFTFLFVDGGTQLNSIPFSTRNGLQISPSFWEKLYSFESFMSVPGHNYRSVVPLDLSSDCQKISTLPKIFR